jgi:NADPH-dependent curcumin reductase CurA
MKSREMCESHGLVNRQITLAARPVGMPQESDFELVESETPSPGPGEVLVRSLWLSLDPYMRGRMSEARSYAKPTQIGEPMTGQVVGEVIESGDPRFASGDIVAGQLGWQDYAVARGGTLRTLDPSLAPIQTALHVLGTTGLTAYFGLFDVGLAKPGDAVVVSGAAGAVGQIVGQLAELAGCSPVVGIAGGPEKVQDLTELYGYDTGIDYKHDDVNGALKDACPDGVDVYFDNVGGALSETVFRRLAIGARIPICGQVSQYNLAEPELAPRNLSFLIVFRARMQGFLVTDYAHRFDEGLRRLGRWLADGKLRYREDVTEGLENAPGAFIGMLNGANRGKTLVKIADPTG